MKRFDQARYEFLLMMHDDGMATQEMEDELDRIESMLAAGETYSEEKRHQER